MHFFCSWHDFSAFIQKKMKLIKGDLWRITAKKTNIQGASWITSHDFPFITSINFLPYTVLQFATAVTDVFLQGPNCVKQNVIIMPKFRMNVAE
jgi:hypothetical protein